MKIKHPRPSFCRKSTEKIKKTDISVAFWPLWCIISMEHQKYISLVTELRQVAQARALKLLNDNDAAEDVAGEVLLRLWEKYEYLHDDADELKRLADKTARNLSLNHLRNRQRHSIIRIFHRHEKDDDVSFDLPDIPDLLTPHQYVEDKEAGDIVQRAMSRLPYNWRRIVELREWQDMNFAEIAQVLGTTESSCRGMMSKARQRLLQLINEMT
jgi:RNA polymerase sigma-70 factor (ECF subfamily)